jgi:hypothetical protein
MVTIDCYGCRPDDPSFAVQAVSEAMGGGEAGGHAGLGGDSGVVTGGAAKKSKLDRDAPKVRAAEMTTPIVWSLQDMNP